MVWAAAIRIGHHTVLPKVEISALYVAGVALISKELLFRYMLGVARRVRSGMLVANAWHARSDAASSLVVGVGIVGNLAGYPFSTPWRRWWWAAWCSGWGGALVGRPCMT
jgi:divalent metal cation (Fe/Co/Zn/Cd) transporter